MTLLLLWLILGTSLAFNAPIRQLPIRVSSPNVNSRPFNNLFSTLDTRSTDQDPAIEVEDESEDNVGAWIPIGSARALGGLGPQQVRVMGLDLVVWQSQDDKWSVMSDVCPHRMAPLSQGRVDPQTGCIECPYHGWQFDTQGYLTALPHADPEIDVKNVPGSKASTFPAHLTGDLIWAFLPSSIHGEMFLQSVLPEDMYPTVREDAAAKKTLFVRELPYSADFLIENFMDPSHIPFAHNSLQSVRSDASSIPMKVVASNFTHVETSFEDLSRGVKRDGIVSFQRPTMYHFRTRSNATADYVTNLNIHIVPIEAGKSRVLFGSVIFDWLPDWLKHAASNRFLNTDVWLHNAEYQARMRSKNQSPYLFASEADVGVKVFRQWWSKHGFQTSPPNTFGPAPFEALTLLSRREQIDPWKHHTRQCSSCRKALKAFKRVQVGGLVASAFSAILLRRWPALALLVSGAGLWTRHAAAKICSVMEGNPHPSGIGDRSPAHAEGYESSPAAVSRGETLDTRKN